MSNFYKNVKNLPSTFLSDKGYKFDALKEGFFRPTGTDGVFATYQITGVWTHVEIFRGLRFSEVNRYLLRCAQLAGWHKAKSDMFKLKLLGLFREKLGSFCASVEDLGVYCPPNSDVRSVYEISTIIGDSYEYFNNLTNLNDAIDYLLTNELFDSLSKYMLTAAAKIAGRHDLWDLCMSRYRQDVESDESYRLLLLNM